MKRGLATSALLNGSSKPRFYCNSEFWINSLLKEIQILNEEFL